MGEVHRIALWRARRAAKDDVLVGAPPFVLEEPCPGCGQRRVATMVWRRPSSTSLPAPLPRMEPHFLCRDGEVVWQEVTDAGIPLSRWSEILGRFEAERESG
ncbi:MAG: hypothetical protein ACRD3M_00355 [Thermoanaerobaculia bacterium]